MEKKDLYNKIKELSKLYTQYHKKIENCYKEKSQAIIYKIQLMICEMSNIYFCNHNYDYMYQLTKEIEFLIRDMKDCQIIQPKQNLILSKILGEIGIILKN